MTELQPETQALIDHVNANIDNSASGGRRCRACNRSRASQLKRERRLQPGRITGMEEAVAKYARDPEAVS